MGVVGGWWYGRPPPLPLLLPFDTCGGGGRVPWAGVVASAAKRSTAASRCVAAPPPPLEARLLPGSGSGNGGCSWPSGSWSRQECSGADGDSAREGAWLKAPPPWKNGNLCHPANHRANHPASRGRETGARRVGKLFKRVG
jgi:hypothetical protein